jgi:CRP-like cAMP-binding protein
VPLVGSGGIAGGIVAGFGLKGFAPMVGTDNLIIVYAAFQLCALVAVRFVINRGPNPEEAYAVAAKPNPVATKSQAKEKGGLLRKVPHLRYTAILAGTVTMSLTLIDFQFKAISRESLQNEALAGFMGSFHGFSGLLALAVQLFVASRVVSRFGVMTTLLIFPLVLFSGSFGLLMLPILAMAVVVKGSDKVVGDTVYSSVNQLILFPVAPDLRPMAKSFLDIVRNSARGAAAVVLILLSPVIAVREFSYIVMLLLACGMLAAVRIKKDYVRMLLSTLRTRDAEVEDEEVDLMDAAGRRVLIDALQSRNPHQALYALRILDKVEKFDLVEHLPKLLQHESADVVVEALRCVERRVPKAMEGELVLLLTSATDRRVRSQVVVSLAAYANDENLEMISTRLEDADVRVRAAAIAGLIKYYGIEGMFRAIGTLTALLKSSVEEERKAVAGLFGQIGLSSFYKPLIPLLSDESAGVRRNALRSAGTLGVPALVPHIVSQLNRSDTRQEAIDALAAYPEAVILPLLEPTLEGESRSLHVPKVLLRIGSQAAADLLLKHYQGSSLSMRNKMLEALTGLRRMGRQMSSEITDRLVFGELELYGKFGAQAARLRHATGEEEQEIYEAVTHLRIGIMKQVFGLLALTRDPATMEMAYAGWREKDVRKQANAAELMDQTLEGELRTAIGRRMLEDPADPTDGISADSETDSKRWLYEHGDIGLRRLLAGEVEGGQERGRSQEHRRRLRLLRTVPLFQGVPAKDLWPMVDALQEVVMPAGESLFREGEPGDCLYIVSSGRVGVFRGGRRIAGKGAQDNFGETAVLSGRPRTASVVTEESVELLRLSSDDFYEALFDRTELALEIIKLLSRKLRGEMDHQIHAGNVAATRAQAVASVGLSEGGTQTPFRGEGDPTSQAVMSQIILRRVLVLQKIRLFSQLSQKALVRLAHRVIEVRYAPGEVICRAGEPGDTMYGIIEGKIRVHRGDTEIATLGEGQYFGEMAIIDSSPRTADCTAMEPTVLLELHRHDAFVVCFQQIHVLKGMMAVLGERLRSIETWEERKKTASGDAVVASS